MSVVFFPLGATGGPEGINDSIKSQIIVIIIKKQSSKQDRDTRVSLHLTASPS